MSMRDPLVRRALAIARGLGPVVLLLAVILGAPAACLGQDLAQAAAGFASQWAAGDVSRLQGGFSSDGVRLQWESRPLATLAPQHAGASIREYLGDRERASAGVFRVGEVGGDPPRAFAEIRWESRIRGMTETVTRTLFVAFVSEGGDWRVTEVRVLPQTRL